MLKRNPEELNFKSNIYLAFLNNCVIILYAYGEYKMMNCFIFHKMSIS